MVYVVGGLIDAFGQSEIQYLYDSFGCDFDIGRFQIAVHDAFVVGCFEGRGNLFRDCECLVEWNGRAADALGESRTLHQFHHQIVRADVEQSADIRMV